VKKKENLIDKLKEAFPLLGKTICIQQDTSYRLYFDKWDEEEKLNKKV